MKRVWTKVKLCVGACSICVAAMLCFVYAVPYPAERLKTPAGSVQILDREGQPLRDVLDAQETRSQPMTRAMIADVLVEATLAGEDHRFEHHWGVDPWAIVRAVRANVDEGRVYSGASTLTMQLVRLVDPEPKRTVWNKIVEAVWALRLESLVSKEEIVVQYLNRAPYGNGTQGVEAASRTYFGVGARDVSLAQAAFLAALPRAPSYYNPYRHLERATQRQQHILGLMLARAEPSQRARYQRAMQEPLKLRPLKRPFEAPHFVDHVVAHHGALLADGRTTLRTSLDGALQDEVEVAVERHISQLREEHTIKEPPQAAVVVLDNRTGDVLAWVGSRDWHGDGGQFNAVTALRQPGSTLKPFIYALAFEQGWSPATVIPDVPLRLKADAYGGLYVPRNFDGLHRGPVRVRAALAGSLNIPAVRALRHVGVDPVLERLRRLGFMHLSGDAEQYGLTLALGSAEVSLLELTAAYSALARGGVWLPPRLVAKDAQPPVRTVFSSKVSFLVTDILADEMARHEAFGGRTRLRAAGPMALKTGTSGGARDVWAVGYTPDVAVGVWVGYFDGRSMEGLSGMRGAGPLFLATVQAAQRHRRVATFAPPVGVTHVNVCPLSGQRPGAHCPHKIREFIASEQAARLKTCTWHLELAVDRRNGLRAGPDCPDAANRRFVELPPLYKAWSRLGHIALAPDRDSPNCPTKSTLNLWEATIASPRNGVEFVLDPSRPSPTQSIRWIAEGHIPPRSRWMLNGKPVQLMDSHHDGKLLEGRWVPSKGHHQLRLQHQGTVLAASTFTVR